MSVQPGWNLGSTASRIRLKVLWRFPTVEYYSMFLTKASWLDRARWLTVELLALHCCSVKGKTNKKLLDLELKHPGLESHRSRLSRLKRSRRPEKCWGLWLRLTR